MKISVITVTFNSEKTIRDTIESVLSQNYEEYEHIIVDGKSKDKTMEIVKEYENRYHGKLRYISEKDESMYDAMNKGILMSTGEIIGLLNSDDIYGYKGALRDIANSLKDIKYDGCYADLLFIDPRDPKKINRKWISKIGNVNFGWHPPHPTLYLRKEVYEKVGKYSLKYKVVSDYDFMVRMLKEDIKLYYIKKYLIYMREGGLSTNGIKGYLENLRDSHKILKENKIKYAMLVDIIRIIKTIKQMILAKTNKNIKIEEV